MRSDELENGDTSPISSVVSDRWRRLIRMIMCEVFVPVLSCVEGIAAHWTFEIVFGSVFVRHIRSTYPERDKYLRAEGAVSSAPRLARVHPVGSHRCHSVAGWPLKGDNCETVL